MSSSLTCVPATGTPMTRARRVGVLEKRPEPVLFMGDGTLVYREEIATRLGRRAQFAQRMLNMNLASSVCEVAFEKVQQGEVLPYGELVPAYVRLSQAERDLKKKMENGNFN